MLPAADVMCPHADERALCCVYVSGGKGTMGLCLTCKGAMEGLIARRDGLVEVVATLAALGYPRQDAARFHAELGATWPSKLWRRLVNRALVHLMPVPAREALA